MRVKRHLSRTAGRLVGVAFDRSCRRCCRWGAQDGNIGVAQGSASGRTCVLEQVVGAPRAGRLQVYEGAKWAVILRHEAVRRLHAARYSIYQL